MQNMLVLGYTYLTSNPFHTLVVLLTALIGMGILYLRQAKDSDQSELLVLLNRYNLHRTRCGRIFLNPEFINSSRFNDNSSQIKPADILVPDYLKKKLLLSFVLCMLIVSLLGAFILTAATVRDGTAEQPQASAGTPQATTPPANTAAPAANGGTGPASGPANETSSAKGPSSPAQQAYDTRPVPDRNLNSFLMTAPYHVFSKHPDGLVSAYFQTLYVLTFAYLGAYCFSIGQIFRRMITRDVTAYAFHAISVRFVTACILAVTFLYLFQDSSVWEGTGCSGAACPGGNTGGSASATEGQGAAPGDFSLDLIALVAFSAGFIPETLSKYILRRAKSFLGEPRSSDVLNLEMIEGIDPYIRTRLEEADINDAQHLATANPIGLAISTPYGLHQVLDWIGQAQLFVLLKTERFANVRDEGVRTSFQVLDLKLKGPRVADGQADLSPAAPDASWYHLLNRDPSVCRSYEVYLKLQCGKQDCCTDTPGRPGPGAAQGPGATQGPGTAQGPGADQAPGTGQAPGDGQGPPPPVVP